MTFQKAFGRHNIVLGLWVAETPRFFHCGSLCFLLWMRVCFEIGGDTRFSSCDEVNFLEGLQRLFDIDDGLNWNDVISYWHKWRVRGEGEGKRRGWVIPKVRSVTGRSVARIVWFFIEISSAIRCDVSVS